QYLLVDSLCIIQDDLGDLKKEAATICDVYRNSYLTIMALGASGDNEGLFGKQYPS
ncbi:hypothetical protein B0J11DRAFT_435784, partial [Dendryphion nanum]